MRASIIKNLRAFRVWAARFLKHGVACCCRIACGISSCFCPWRGLDV